MHSPKLYHILLLTQLDFYLDKRYSETVFHQSPTLPSTFIFWTYLLSTRHSCDLTTIQMQTTYSNHQRIRKQTMQPKKDNHRTQTSLPHSSSQPNYLQYDKKELKSKGYQFNELIKEAIVEIHSCTEDEIHSILRKEMKKIEQFDIQDIDYMEVISHWILPKMYYLQEKIKEVKGINMSKMAKHKTAFIEKIKKGLRNYDRVKAFYEGALREDIIPENEDKQPATSAQRNEPRPSEKTQREKKRAQIKKKKKVTSSSSSSSSEQEVYVSRRKSRGRKQRKKSRERKSRKQQ